MNIYGKVRAIAILFAFTLSFSSSAEIIVKTFHDKNGNGNFDTGEALVTGLSVKGLDDSGITHTFSDDGNGTFELNGVTSRIRVQVLGYDSNLREGKSGPTSVFFAEDGDIIFVPIRKNEDDSSSNTILVPCFEKGTASDKVNSPAFVAFRYGEGGVAEEFGGTAANPRMDATIAQIGSTWGVAYQRTRMRAFASTVLKRHVDLGPVGTGGVYIMDYSNNLEKPEVTSIDIQGFQPSVGPVIDFGAINRTISSTRIDSTKPYALSSLEDLTARASYDMDAFNKVGQLAYGDIDVTEDESQLWMVNTNQRSLVSIDATAQDIDITGSVLEHYLIDEIDGMPDVEMIYSRCINTGKNENFGGAEAFTDAEETSWDRNKYFSGDGRGDYDPFTVVNAMNKDEGTTETQLYNTWTRGRNFSYHIPIPKEEKYTVVLHFAEPFDHQIGDRLFDVVAEGVTVLDNFDVVKNAGGAKKAMTYTFEIEATGSTLSLEFKGEFANKVREAFINGIEVSGESMITAGVLRPWGLDFHNGRGYLGIVNDASISQSRDHLMAYVMSFDPSDISAGVTEEIAFPLNYPRERSSNAHMEDPQSLRTAAWMPWIENWDMTHIPLDDRLSFQGGLLCSYPQPVISEINFTADGSMVVQVMDRWAHQTGHLNYSADLSSKTLIIGYASGDILKAFKDEDKYTLELTNSDDGVHYNKVDGPSYSGEFFFQDNFQSTDIAHHGELITGGAAILPGSGEVVSTVINPIETTLEHFDFHGVFSQGVHYYDTETGLKTNAYLFVDQFNIGKANGLGDLEFALAPPSGEVGNYVWCDANSNGIQDPAEFGIFGIELILIDKDNSNAEVARTTTNNAGNYIFQNLVANNCYEIRIDLAQLSAKGYSGAATLLNQGADDAVDSDGDESVLPGFAVAMFCTDALANNQHHLDFGFIGPDAQDVMKAECEDPLTGCATFTLSEVAACVTTNANQEVRFFGSFDDADSLQNEITATTYQVCSDRDTLYTRVNVTGDLGCFSIAQAVLVESGGSTPLEFSTVICEGNTFDANAFLLAQGFSGTPQLFSDAAMTMPISNPVTIASYPSTIYFIDQPSGATCDVTGFITINDIPPGMVDAGNPIESCGLTCVDLTALSATFDANGSGAISALWSSSGSGTFDSDNTFAGARFYCPDSADMLAGSVTLTLAIADDPCGRTIEDNVVITIVNSTPHFLEPGTPDTILCFDPFVLDPVNNDTFPKCRLAANCEDTITASVVDYKVENGDCENIVKLIIRTQRVRYNKVDYFCTDTIYVRAFDYDTFECPPERDSVYCHTPYKVDENGHPHPEETGIPTVEGIPLWPQLNTKCDILIKYTDTEFESECPMMIKRVWQIKNTCSGRYDTCAQWIMVFDTIGPEIKKEVNPNLIAAESQFNLGKPVILIPTSSRDCEAHTYVPPIAATDTCSDVKLVKVRIPDVTSVTLEYSEENERWESHRQIKIPRTEDPIPMYYEAFDGCHNVTRDTCYLYVKDFTRPVTVCDKGINLTVGEGTAWLEAEIFDEGSWDNCGINLMLARRSDWATSCGVNLCDSIVPLCVTEHHDTIWCSVLERDDYVNPVEAHYIETIKWLCEDNQDCASLVVGGWWYDLMKEATINCVDHPYPVDEQYFRKLLDDPDLECFGFGEPLVRDLCDKYDFEYTENFPPVIAPFVSGSPENPLDVMSQIGGGWSKKVPFCCEDACQNVTVELLTMDYWCNWNTCWTTVYVEDKTPPEVVNDLFDVTMTCTSYKQFYEGAVAKAMDGDYEELDSLLGGYDQVQYDGYQKLPNQKPFTYYNVLCDSIVAEKDSLTYDEHLGYKWVTYRTYEATYDTIEVDRHRGQVLDDCGLVKIEEKPWINLDECGNGYIRRVFKFIGQCQIEPSGHSIDTITKYQTIWIQSDCDITPSMVVVPEDVMLQECGFIYDTDGSGNAAGVAHPDHTGWPEYLIDNDCRLLGVGYYDRIFKIVGGDQGCYKILRTWCIADWCAIGENPAQGQWWQNPRYQGKYLSYVQKIVLLDTIAPVCNIDLPDLIEVSACSFNLDTDVTVEDECGALSFSWELYNKKGDLVDFGSGDIPENTSEFNITSEGLVQDEYKLKVTVTDECQNEGLCIKEFTVTQVKKPTPICISSLTLELTPMDTDSDGEIDNAMGTVWAKEFDQSSSAACGSSDSDLEFRLATISDGEVVLPDEENTSLTFDCNDIGTTALRLFVLDPSGQWDYCEVFLVVQNGSGGCDNVSSTVGNISGRIVNELNQMIHRVELSLEEIDGDLLQKQEVSGNYRFELAQGFQAYLKPYKNDDHLNGVSTRDLIAIQQHLLGKKKIPSWYLEQAADANNDGKISTVDIIHLRRLILGKVDELPESTSWRFFESSERNQQYFINPMLDQMQVDFIGVKIGDINIDSDPSRKAPRSADNVTLNVSDFQLRTGDYYTVPVTAKDFKNILGMQFTLIFDVDKIEVRGIEAGKEIDFSDEHFNLDNLAEGWMTASWFDRNINHVSLADETVLFNLMIKARSKTRLSDVIGIDSRKTSAEAYNATNSDLGIALEFTQKSTETFALYQNTPNPFRTETTIGFNIPNSTEATLTIFDVTGKVLKRQKQFVVKGYHQWSIDKVDLPSSGVLYYKLDAAEQTAVKKMILIAR